MAKWSAFGPIFQSSKPQPSPVISAPLAPDVICANVNYFNVGGSSSGLLGAINTPYFSPIQLSGAPNFALDSLGIRVVTLEAATTMGVAIYSYVVTGAGTFSANLECQLNATLSGAANALPKGQVTTGAAGSGATVPFYLDFTSKRYVVGAMVSSVTTLAPQSYTIGSQNTNVGIWRWTAAARSSVTDWPSSFTNTSAAVGNGNRFPVVMMWTATGTNLL